MKKYLWVVLFASILVLGACTTVEPGFEGIKVVKTGTAKGVSDAPVVVGRVWYNPFTTDIIEYPVFVQTVTWTQSTTEESPADDSITFNSSEGASINADISLAYHIQSGYAGKIFMKYHCSDIKDLTWKYMRIGVRDVVTVEAAKLKTLEIIGLRKQELLEKAKAALQAKMSPDGIIVDTLAFVGEMRPSSAVKDSINAVIMASQNALKSEMNVKTAKANADQAVETAKGEYESAVLKAKANKELQMSLTPELLRLKAIDKWDGHLPYVNGSGTIPMIQIEKQ